MKKTAIIGSGFGGLSLAIRLQAKGYEVHLFEKNSQVGGHAQQIKKDGYTFDAGPSLITAPEILNSIFQAAGKDVSDYVDLVPLDPYYRVWFHDQTLIDYTGDSEAMISQMEKFNPRDADKYYNFISRSRRIYNAVIRDGLGSTAFNKISYFLKFIPKAISLGAVLPAHFLVSRYFKDFRHRFMFSFHPLFIGGNPFKVPSVYLMISYLEKTGGVWYTKGGMYSLVSAMEKLFIELGGTVHTNSEVKEIRIENGAAAGVDVHGKFQKFDIVVSNADTTNTYSNLIKHPGHAWSKSKTGGIRHAMSAFLLYLGVKKKFPQLLHHTLILSRRYKELVFDLFDRHTVPDDFSMYLHVPSITDQTMAPEGSESITILAPVSNLKSGTDWQQFGEVLGNRIIDFLENDFGMDGLRANIETKLTYTPADFQKYRNSYLGSPWGMEPELLQTAYFRPHNNDPKISNLYLVGAGTHPGAGLPGVMLSAEATEKLIVRD